jgi:hypothetical protein
VAVYWVYENWTNKRVRIHRGACSYCNHGYGCQSEDSGRNGMWHGPFSDRAEAFDVAKKLDQLDTKPCAVCSP